jgi:replicative DNA helicase
MSRTPPQDIEAEVAVLGSCILDVSTHPAVQQIVGPDDFVRPAHRILYQHVLALDNSADLVSLKGRLRDAGQLEAVGGIEYAGLILESTPSAANAEYYAGVVRDKAILRRLIDLARGLADGAYHAEDPEDLIRQASQDLYAQHQRLCSRDEWNMGVQEAADAALAHAEKVQLDPDAYGGLRFGFEVIDRKSGGMQKGERWILAAPSGAGKTSFAGSCVCRWADQGKCGLVVSGEMNAQSLGKRYLQALANVSGSRMRDGRLEATDWQRLHDARQRMRDWRLQFAGPGLTVHEIAMRARQASNSWSAELHFVVVDYLQIMHAEGNGIYEQTTALSRGLKRLALELNCPLLVLSQYDRSAVKGRNGLPNMHFLKGSGDIENDSDGVLLLHVPEEIDTKTDHNAEPYREAWLRIAKLRDGGATPWPDDMTYDDPNVQRARWYPRRTWFTDWLGE